MLVLMLSAPSLRHTHTIGMPTKLSVFIDCSQSMGTPDREMEDVRKLSVARNLHWLELPSEFLSAEKVAESVGAACRLIRSALNVDQLDDNLLRSTSTAFLAQLTVARKHAEAGAFSDAELKAVDLSLFTPLKQLVGRKQRIPTSNTAPPKELVSLIDAAERWRSAAVQKVMAAAVAQTGGDRKVAAALERFDDTSRLDRVRSVLLDGGEDSMIAKLSRNFEVELLALTNDTAQVLWRSTEGRDASTCLFPAPNSPSTNLGSSILDRLQPASGDARGSDTKPDARPRSAAVVFTDGRHNSRGSPIEAAKRLGDSNIPLHCIGVGSNVRPLDLAISDIDAPETVFYEDRVSGWITLKDDMPSGQPFQITIASGGSVLWRKEMITSQRGSLKIPFDFPVKEVVSSQLAESNAKHSVIPLPLKASVTVLPQEREIRNNTSDFLVRATTGKRRMLLLDSRPRWETRYIRNLFERDPQWTVNFLIADANAAQPLQRGSVPGSFPSDQTLLDEYDMVILGDVPSGTLSDVELTRLVHYVTKRGGGLLFLDGQRRELAGYTQTPLSQLIPVFFFDAKQTDSDSGVEALVLTDSGRTASALKLDTDAPNPDETWARVTPPRWVSRTSPLPGSEVLIEVQTSGERFPALVTRRQGAGNIAYLAFDESWRWRSGVAGKFQERFWSQLVNFIADPPFSSSNDQISLDSDAFRYVPGATALIRARIKDSKQREVIKGVLWRDGSKVGSLELTADPLRKDLFKGQTFPLQAGVYDFGLDEGRDQPGADLRVRFEVQSEQKGELAELTLDETLLSQMAEASHGRYLREENTNTLYEMIEPLQTGRTVTSETPLAQGYPWFCMILFLLSLEWMLRKRVGLV
jgi:uncharacterized membrane protein